MGLAYVLLVVCMSGTTWSQIPYQPYIYGGIPPIPYLSYYHRPSYDTPTILRVPFVSHRALPDGRLMGPRVDMANPFAMIAAVDWFWEELPKELPPKANADSSDEIIHDYENYGYDLNGLI